MTDHQRAELLAVADMIEAAVKRFDRVFFDLTKTERYHIERVQGFDAFDHFMASGLRNAVKVKEDA